MICLEQDPDWVKRVLKFLKAQLQRNPKDKQLRREYASLMADARRLGLETEETTMETERIGQINEKLEEIRVQLEKEEFEPTEAGTDEFDAKTLEKFVAALAVVGMELKMEPKDVMKALKELTTSKKSFLMSQLKRGSKTGKAKATIAALRKGL